MAGLLCNLGSATQLAPAVVVNAALFDLRPELTSVLGGKVI